MNAQVPATRSEPKAQLVAGGNVAAIIPRSLEETFRLAGAISASGMAPNTLNSPEKVMVAIIAGAELGMPPFQSLQSFAVINGRPALWGDGLIGVVRSQGFKVREWFEGEGDDMIARCEVTRPDSGEVIPGEFSVADAKRANLWGKSGPWQSSPKRMLKMRARGFACRDGAADVLRGFQLREEVEDYQPIREVPTPPAGLAARLRAANVSGEGFSTAQAEEPAHDPETGEIAEFVDAPADDGLPIRDVAAEAFPGDALVEEPKPDLPPMKTGADLLAETENAKPSLAERVAKFKASCAGAGTTKLMDAWRKSSVLRTDLDASDPEEVAALTDWWQAAFDAAETAEKGA
jgi:hypothetical protein